MHVISSHSKVYPVHRRPWECALYPFHGENTGSIPVGRSKHINDLVKEVWDRRDRGPNCEGCR
jgi:hypothetical protein